MASGMGGDCRSTQEDSQQLGHHSSNGDEKQEERHEEDDRRHLSRNLEHTPHGFADDARREGTDQKLLRVVPQSTGSQPARMARWSSSAPPQ